MSDVVRFACGVCGKRLKAPPELAGRRVKCGCGQLQVVPGPPPAAARGLRIPLLMLAGLGAGVVVGVGGWFAYDWWSAVRVVECYALDLVLLDPGNRRLKAVALGIRTRPAADDLDAGDLEVVAPDGRRFGDARVYEFGRGRWLVVAVPEADAAGGGLKLLQKSSGRTADLPARIESRKTNELR